MLDSLAGYVRMPEPAKADRPSPPAGNYLLVIAVGRGPASTRAPRVVGRIVLRGYVAQARPDPDGAPAGSSIELGARFAVPRIEGAHLRPIGRLGALSESGDGQAGLRAVQSGRAYRITSPANQNRVTPALAEALEGAFQRFAEGRGFTPENPVPIALTRGYEAADRGHGRGQAVDIASVAGRSLREWKHDGDGAVERARRLPDPEARRIELTDEVRRNLGYQLYRALMAQGGWRVYNDVTQLFGPWTDTLGPWRRLRFEPSTDAQRQLMAEQERIFQAHQDHIHVALG